MSPCCPPPLLHARSYWALYGLISAAERPLDRVLAYVPYYHAVKLLLLVWLQSPAYAGAQRVYLEALRPLLLRWQPVADDFLAALLRSLVGAGAGTGIGGGWQVAWHLAL